jgi:hypothetical protein
MLKVKRLARHAQSQKIGKTCSKSKDWQDKQKSSSGMLKVKRLARQTEIAKSVFSILNLKCNFVS